MSDMPLAHLFGIMAVLIAMSAFFSGSETALMSINRYRLRHLARSGHRGARLAETLLKRPDRLIGLILLGNNLVNFTASSLATVIALRIGGTYTVAISIGIFTLVVLIFAELAPKTLAALKPRKLALPAAYIYYPLLKVTFPFVWLINVFANGILWLFGVRSDEGDGHSLSTGELRTVVAEAGAMIPKRHQKMLLSILDLENVTVDDIMVPRQDIFAVDLDDDWDTIREQIQHSQHTRVPIFRGDLDQVIGVLHMRQVVRALAEGQLTADSLPSLARDAYFVPESTPLNKQLLNFQGSKRRVGLVVDEYGDIQGLVTLEDILEEIVGEFTSDPNATHRDIFRDANGSYIVHGNMNVRALNRLMKWSLPIDGAKTLSGLIVEFLETIPEPGTGLKIAGLAMEIVKISDNTVRTVRVFPPAEGARPD
ncbi:MAG: HlyC/CorC family transporter [Gammaproteobacteria bacterium]|nr:HlyC/CorC family transporter [Gammaproteobacteria bacterium]